MIAGIFNQGSMPALERLVQFTGARHRVLAHNIANLSTPRFRPKDLDVKAFQREMARAIDQRRRSPSGAGPLPLRDTAGLAFGPDHVEARATRPAGNVLFHDGNDRDLERTMQSLAENTLAHSAGIEMMRNQFNLLETAIRERI